MSVDFDALCDRLYADTLGATLRRSGTFWRADTTVCWADIETHVRQRADAHGQDLSATPEEVARALNETENIWRTITAGDQFVREIGVLRLAARKLLQANGREMILRVDPEEPGREILRWRFVSLALPAGILIAAATESGFLPSKAVRILDRSMSPDGPVAQNHLHHAAMTSFEDLWALLRFRALTQGGDFMRRLQEPRASCPGLHPGVCPGTTNTQNQLLAKDRFVHAKHMTGWADLIRQAFIAKRVLDRHSRHNEHLAECPDNVCATGKRTLRAFLAGQTKLYGGVGTAYPWPSELLHLGRRYRDARAPTSLRVPRFRPDLLKQETAEESELLARAFTYLDDKETGDDRVYERLFLQYLRVKAAVFGLLVHPPGEGGLPEFLAHFNQIKVYAPEAEILRPQKPDEPGLDVRATEYRVAPDAWLTALRHDNEVEQQLLGESTDSEAAWLIHFKRKEADKRLPHYITEVRKMESEASAIIRALNRQPTRLRTLRGVDICGVEGWQPLWVSAPTLRRLRDSSREIAAIRPGFRLVPLRLTIHAGEDFEWLTSGVRAVAEPFRWKLIERGDRIGHAMAVTLDPANWWQRHEGQIKRVRKFDRLLDLAFLAEYSKHRSAQEDRWLYSEIRDIVKALGIDPELETTSSTTIDLVTTAQKVWQALGGPVTRRLMGTSQYPDVGPRHERWIHRYLWNWGTRERSREIIPMKAGKRLWLTRARYECSLLTKARAQLIREIARWQVCIESNPTSNLVVCSLDAMASQDFLQRRPTEVAGFGKETLTWTISTDDPITFSTTLADEYAYAWAGMVLRKNKPYDPSYARGLLDEAAQTSMRMRFTTPRRDRQRRNPHGQKDESHASRD